MNIAVSDLRPTIIPRSDQINAEQLLSGPVTITVADVRVSSTPEQPVVVHYEGDNGRPYKPCLTMRKVLILAWGPDGREWAGKSMSLYCDPQVKFGGAEVGGIRISHLSDIDRDIQVSLTATKGKKALHTIKRMQVQSGLSAAQIADWTAAIEAAAAEELDDIKQQALDAATAVKDRDAFAAFSAAAKRRRAAVSA